MLEYITSIVDAVKAAADGNQLVTAAILLPLGTVVSGIVAGAITYAIVKLPVIILRVIKAQFIVSLSFDNSTYAEEQVYPSVVRFIYAHCTSYGTRNMRMSIKYMLDINGDTFRTGGVEASTIELSIGTGRHYFTFNGRLFWVDCYTSEQSLHVVQHIKIFSFGRSHDIFRNLLADINPPKVKEGVSVYNYTERDGWVETNNFTCCGFDELALTADIRDYFKDTTQYFLDNGQAYVKLGLAWKETFMLYGKPGSGKTSIIRAVAKEFKLPVCTLNLASMTDNDLVISFRKLPKRAILLIEDCDDSPAVKQRSAEKGYTELAAVKLSTLLNELDGLNVLQENMVFMTTNCIEVFDSAILRGGRVDHMIELPALTSEIIQLHLERLYPGVQFDNMPCLNACELTHIKNMAKLDGVKALEIIRQEYQEKLKVVKF